MERNGKKRIEWTAGEAELKPGCHIPRTSTLWLDDPHGEDDVSAQRWLKLAVTRRFDKVGVLECDL